MSDCGSPTDVAKVGVMVLTTPIDIRQRAANDRICRYISCAASENYRSGFSFPLSGAGMRKDVRMDMAVRFAEKYAVERLRRRRAVRRAQAASLRADAEQQRADRAEQRAAEERDLRLATEE